MFSELPSPEGEIHQYFEKDGDPVGGVGIALYESPDDLEEAYQIIFDGMASEDLIEDLIREFGSSRLGIAFNFPDDLGDQAYLVGTYTVLNDQDPAWMQDLFIDTASDGVEVLFRRCSAVVHIRLGGYEYVPDKNIAEINSLDGLAYAQRLDKRLTPLVCR